MFGDTAISVVIFEQYVADRRGTMSRLFNFLGISCDARHVREDRVFNDSAGKTVLSPFWLAVWRTPIYQRVLRPLMSADVRESIRGSILPVAPRRPAPPKLETVEYLIDNARDEERELRDFLKREEPIWNFESVRARFCDSEPVCTSEAAA